MCIRDRDFYRKNPTSNRYRFHNDTILQFSDKSKLEEEIAEGRFEVYLQPKVDFNRHIIGGEALIRYHDHQGKLIMPNDFINYLENARGIHYIDFFVFETVCKLLEKWKKENLLLKPVSVNFSRYTLRIPEYIETVSYTHLSTNWPICKPSTKEWCACTETGIRISPFFS